METVVRQEFHLTGGSPELARCPPDVSREEAAEMPGITETGHFRDHTEALIRLNQEVLHNLYPHPRQVFLERDTHGAMEDVRQVRLRYRHTLGDVPDTR